MDDVSVPVASTASFAQSVMRGHTERGGDPADIFGAFVGLIAEQDLEMATVSLKALDQALSNRDLRPTAER